MKITVMKINIFQYLFRAIKEKIPYLGWTWGLEARVYHVKFPFLGEKRLKKTLIHEYGHLLINMGDGVKDKRGHLIKVHKDYDKLTRHGIFQKRVETLPVPEYEYGTFDKLRFKG